MDKWKYPTHKSFIVDLNNDPNHFRHNATRESKETQTEVINPQTEAPQTIQISQEQSKSGSDDVRTESYPIRIPINYNKKKRFDWITFCDRWIPIIALFLLCLLSLALVVWIAHIENTVEELYSILNNSTCNITESD